MSKQGAAPTESGPSGQLRRELRLRDAVAIGIGGTVGGGSFVLVGVVAGRAGPAALVAFAIAGLASLFIALPYAELSCRLPRAGGGYAFVREVLGQRWGFCMGWLYWGAYIFVSGYVTIGFGGYLSTVTPIPVPVGAILLVAVCTALNLLGAKMSGWVQSIVITLAVVGLGVFAFWGLPSVDANSMTPFLPHGAEGIGLAVVAAFLSFGGFDMVSAAGEEIREPQRNLPRAIVITLGSVLALYLLVTFVALGTTSSELLGSSSSPLSDAARGFGGAVAVRVVLFCALLTTAAAANATLVVTSRTVFAMSRDRLLPRPFAQVSPRTGAPRAAVLICGVLLSLVGLVSSVEMSSTIGGFLYAAHFVPPLIALVLLRRQSTQQPRFSTPWPWLFIPLAFVCSVCMIIASGGLGIVVGTAWIAGGMLLYFGTLWAMRQRDATTR